MPSTSKIIVHWLENSRSQRIIWLLEELELSYEIKVYKRDTKTMLAGADLKTVHPLGKGPVVSIEEDGKTIVLAESGAIVEFLIERYGAGKLSVGPEAGAAERANYLYWIHWAEGTAMYPLMLSIVFAQMPKQAPWIGRFLVSTIAGQVMTVYVKPKLVENFAYVESELATKPYFAGDHLTGADIMMIFPVEGLESGLGYDNYPNIQKWVDLVKARPAYQRAEAKGGPTNLKAFIS